MISIVVPMYNAEAFLSRMVESILAQTFMQWEAILIDDGSTDRTFEIAQAFARQDARIRVIAQGHQGVSVARNRGLAATSESSKYIAFLDSDDVWTPQALSTLADRLQRSRRSVGVHGLARFIDENSVDILPGECESWSTDRFRLRRNKGVRDPISRPTTFANLMARNCILTGTALFYRQALQLSGWFDPCLAMCEDWDLYLRISRQGDITLVPEVVLGYRKHTGNSSRDKCEMDAWSERVRLKTATSSKNNIHQRRLAAAAMNYYGTHGLVSSPVHVPPLLPSYSATGRRLRQAMISGWITSAHSTPMTPDRRSTVVFAPHQDDETLGCGGLIALRREMKASVKVVFMTDGGHSHDIVPYLSVDHNRIARIRREEAVGALQVLGVPESDIYFMNYPDGGLRSLSAVERLELIQSIARFLNIWEPEEVYVPHARDVHSDHEETFTLVRSALQEAGSTATIFQYPIWLFWWRNRLLRFRQSNLFSGAYRLPIHQVLDRKIQAICCYASQADPNILPPGFLNRFFRPYELYFRVDGPGTEDILTSHQNKVKLAEFDHRQR